jgi:hypothetical protein
MVKLIGILADSGNSAEAPLKSIAPFISWSGNVLRKASISAMSTEVRAVNLSQLTGTNLPAMVPVVANTGRLELSGIVPVTPNLHSASEKLCAVPAAQRPTDIKKAKTDVRTRMNSPEISIYHYLISRYHFILK